MYESVVTWILTFGSGKSHVASLITENIFHLVLSGCDVVSLTLFLLVALDVRQLSLFRIKGHSLCLSLIKENVSLLCRVTHLPRHKTQREESVSFVN